MSRKKLDKIIVVDLETTCWEPAESRPEGEVQDIIEVGLALIDTRTLEVARGPEILVVPGRSTVSEFCTRLTTITPEMVAPENGALPFVHVLRMLRDYGSKDTLWASYGDFDRKMFERQCQDLGLEYPFGPRHLNVKTLLTVANGWSNEVGMSKALDLLGMPLMGTHHRGIDDAENIAKILASMLHTIRSGR